jgi:hypothetical protein
MRSAPRGGLALTLSRPSGGADDSRVSAVKRRGRVTGRASCQHDHQCDRRCDDRDEREEAAPRP